MPLILDLTSESMGGGWNLLMDPCARSLFLWRKFQSQTEWVQRLGDLGDALNQPLKMDMIHTSKSFLWTVYDDVLKRLV